MYSVSIKGPFFVADVTSVSVAILARVPQENSIIPKVVNWAGGVPPGSTVSW